MQKLEGNNAGRVGGFFKGSHENAQVTKIKCLCWQKNKIQFNCVSVLQAALKSIIRSTA